MALWACYHSDSFGATVEKCVNLLGDSDSTASVAGQIAGAMYGYSRIDPPMLTNLERWDDGDTLLRAVVLYYMNGRAQDTISGGDNAGVGGREQEEEEDDDMYS
mmetsp:Transcript_14706/g.25963  ORF Transcript_14706/g.25963 Transcript_14706/m.25963 type:complete len:104 (-) Transcript_14706:130-441(-)